MRRMSRSGERVIVLGAGIQGACAALALQHRGHCVTLVDQAPDCMLRASLRNEAKIHLGFVYANDPYLKTPLLLLSAGMRFADLIQEWLGRNIAWQEFKARPFTYVVALDSLLSPSAILSSYEQLQTHYSEMRGSNGANYLGDSPVNLWRWTELSTLSGLINLDLALASVETVERAIDLVPFRELIRSALIGSPRIQASYGHRVEAVVRCSRGFRVEGTDPEGSLWRREADIVVNCLWSERLRIDAGLGIRPDRPWVHRLKYRLLGTLPPSLRGLPSLTFVLGPFGDLVVHPDGKSNLSWYPTCMRGWCTELSPPESWQGPCSGQLDPRATKSIAERALREFSSVVPALEDFTVETVDAGSIFSWGESDIDDPQSELHRRSDIGVHSHDGYFSIDTGKFTCAPLFAHQLSAAL